MHKIMGQFYSYQGFTPVVHPDAFVHPQAVVIGNVIIGRDVYIGPGAVLRGDWGRIEIGDGCNVQENCVIHVFPGKSVVLEPSAHIGHGAIIHGGHLGANCLIGMNAVVMDDAVIGAESIVGALTFIPARMKVPERSVVVGNPGKVVKKVSDEMIEWKTKGTALYRSLPASFKESLRPCEPLKREEANRPDQAALYATWKDTKDEQ